MVCCVRLATKLIPYRAPLDERATRDYDPRSDYRVDVMAFHRLAYGFREFHRAVTLPRARRGAGVARVLCGGTQPRVVRGGKW
jgi:hypothetical protein